MKASLALVIFSAIATGHAAQQRALKLVADIAMPNVKGRIDHLAVDPQSNRLFIAALGNNTLEVIDLNAKRAVRSVAGFREPQGVLYLSDRKRVYVTNGSADRVDVLDATALNAHKHFAALSDADNIRYDDAAGKIYIGYGRGALRVVDAVSEQAAGDIRLSGHPESFQLERSGERIFVNVPDAKHIAVVNRQKRAVTETWPTADASRNYPMALDEATHRLFVGARTPPVMLVYDTSSGKVVARHTIGGDTDDIFFDAARKRVYVICGEGRVDVFKQETRTTIQ